MIKKINWNNWEKYIQPLIDQNNTSHHLILFYKFLDDGIEISTSYDIFLIKTFISFDKIEELYPSSFVKNDVTVRFSEQSNMSPSVIKFCAEYLARAIPEDGDI